MSIVHRVRLLLAVTIAFAFLCVFAVGLQSTRSALRDGAQLQNRSAARILAAEIADVAGNAEAVTRLLLLRFDSGGYRSIRLVGADGRIGFSREAMLVGRAPDWFVRWARLEADPASAPLASSQNGAGQARIEVAGASGPWVDSLWKSGLELGASLLLLATFVGAMALAAMRPLQRQLDRAIRQVEELPSGRELGPTQSDVPEIRRLSRALQNAARHFRQAFDSHSLQLELMREEAQRDPATGLSARRQFLQRLEAALQSRSRAAPGGLVLFRLLDLEGLNRTLGHEATDRAIRAIAQTLQAYTRRVDGCFVGRLNGSDFALSLPARGVAMETAEAVLDLLRAALPAYGNGVAVVAGAVEIEASMDVGALLRVVDAAMIRAVERGAFAVEAGIFG